MGKKRKRLHKEKSDEITINTDDLKEKGLNFVKKAESFGKNKYVKYGFIVLMIVVLMIISSYVRLGPLNLPVTDDWAENMLENEYKQAIEQQVRTERPNLPESSVRRVVDEEYASFREENREMLDPQVEQLSSQYKSLLQNDDGMTYLLGIDEYVFYSYAKWYDKNGFFGTEVVDGEERFMLRNGRFGESSRFRLHPFLISSLHDVWSPFNPNFDIEWASFYIQVVLIAIGAIPLFFLSRKIGGTTGGFIGAALVLTAVPLVTRTLGGSSDDDVHTVIYTFAMMALLFSAIGKKTRTIAIMAGIAGLINAIFMFGWSGWWYGFLLVLGSAGLYVIYEFVRKRIKKETLTRAEWINKSAFVVVFFVSAIVFAMLLSPLSTNSAFEQAERVFSSPTNPIELVLRLRGGADVSVGAGEYPLWPNVLRTVAELNPAEFRQVIGNAGQLPLGGGAGILFFYLGLAGIVSLFLRYKEDSKYPFFGMVLLVWMAGMIFIAMDAVRFILMASIPILLSVGALIGAITGPVARYVEKEMKVRKSIFVSIISILFVFWFLLTPIANARSASEGAIPIFDDAWYDSVYAMRDHSDERGIVSSWWDYGHFFQAYGEQSVTFDGGDQGKRIYWMGKSLLTDNSTKAHDILKVMNCGQEKPYDLIEEYLGERYRPTRIKLDITRLDKNDARAYLENEGLPDDLIEEVLGLTHCDDLMPMYFVTSEDMVGKAPVWSHFGGWDFTRAYFYYRLRHLPLTEVYELAETNLGMSEDDARSLYNEATALTSEDRAARWISSYDNFLTRQKTRCSESDGVVTCSFGMVLQQDQTGSVVLRRAVVPLDDLSETELLLQVVNPATGTPMSQEVIKPENVLIERDGVFEEHEFDSAGLGFDLVLMDEDTDFSALMTEPSLSKSMFTRLFFMEGRGSDLDMFEKISDVTSFRGERIIVWEVHP